MYKLLIVDDERRTINGLVRHFDWKGVDIEIVGEAYNGEEAFKLLEQLKPDILLSDIKMPIMDGITLCEKTREFYSDIEIILMSGYEDIDYMRLALKNGVIDYILKPINFEELKTSIQKATEKIYKSRESQSYFNTLENEFKSNLPILKQNLLFSLINGFSNKGISSLRTAKYLGLDFESNVSWILYISIVNFGDFFDKAVKNESELAVFAVMNIATELASSNFTCNYIPLFNNDCALILTGNSNIENDTILEIAENIRNNILTNIEIDVVIGVSQTCYDISEIPSAFKSVKEAARYSAFVGGDKIVEAIHNSNEDNLKIENIVNDFEWEHLKNILKSNDAKALEKFSDELVFRVQTQKITDILFCKNLFSQLVIFTLRVARLNGINAKLKIDEAKYINDIYKSESVVEIGAVLKEIGCKIGGLIVENQGNDINVISKIKSHIKSNYYQGFTINNIAKYIHMSPTYVSYLFKKETGMTVLEYATNIRMEKACELLVNTDRSVLEICFDVGYVEQGYFTKQFKKFSGLTPTEYKKKVRNNE